MTQLDEIVVLAKQDDRSLAAEVRAAIIAAAQGVGADLMDRAEEFLPIGSNGGFGARIGAPTDDFAYAHEE